MSYYSYNAGNSYDEGTGVYNPRMHFAAAQSAGFHVGSGDDLPRTLYVGNLDPAVNEEFLSTLFNQVGSLTKAKVIYDPHSDPYAFVEFADHKEAQNALQELKVNWATEPGQQQVRVDTSKHFHVFVGDLSPDVDNKGLREAFVPFGEVSDAKVIRDPTTLKSKGYGFVSYPKREEAERAIEQMNGQWLGRRTIRTNWATRKPAESGGSGSAAHASALAKQQQLSYDDVYKQTSAENTSVYCGNIGQNATEEDIRSVFAQFGTIDEIRVFKQQGYGFIRYANKDAACQAICEMTGKEFCGSIVRCSWGKVDSGVRNPAVAAGGYGYGFGGATTGMAAYGNNAAQAGYPSNGSGQSTGSNYGQQQYYQGYYNQYYQGGAGGPGAGSGGPPPPPSGGAGVGGYNRGAASAGGGSGNYR